MANPATKRHGTPNWADCATLDLSEAEAFYAALFGWTSERATASDGSVYSVQRLNDKRVAGIYALNDELRAMGVPPHWGTYIEVDDVAAVLKKVRDAGGTVIEDASFEPDVGTFAVIQDNVGAFLRLWHSAPAHGGEIFNVPGAMTWNELFTKEPEKAAIFYQKVFGLEPEPLETPTPYTVLRAAGREVAGILTATPEMGDMPACWDVYFATDDVEETLKLALDAGGKVIREPFDVAGGQARMAVLQDPQGAVFEVIKMQPGSG
ncbi:MAG: VOC family protein [Pseudomonadota bacterium]